MSPPNTPRPQPKPGPGKDSLASELHHDSTPNLGAVLDQVDRFVRRFVAFANQHQAVAVVLWIAHTHIIDALRVTVYLHITSPTPEAGKSRLLDALEQLVAKAWRAVQPSEAALFRKLSMATVTLLLDEADPIWGRDGRLRPETEPQRAVLNAGHTRGTTVPRVVGAGTSMQVQDFKVFGPKAIAGIGEIPDSLRSRSITIRMRRRLPTERIEAFFPDEVADEAALLRDGLAAACAAALPLDLHLLRRELLALGLGDRAADGWAALLGLADKAGDAWGNRARAAAAALTSGARRDEEDLGLRLLADLRVIFGEVERPHLATVEMIDRLAEAEGSPWGDWRGKPITGQAVARLLRPFGIAPATHRRGETTFKGYARTQFEDAWARYLPSDAASDQSRGNNPYGTTTFAESDRSHSDECYPSQNGEKPCPTTTVTALPTETARESDDPLQIVLDTFPGAQVVEVTS